MASIVLIEQATDSLALEITRAIKEMKRLDRARKTHYFYPTDPSQIEKYATVWRMLGYFATVESTYFRLGSDCIRLPMLIAQHEVVDGLYQFSPQSKEYFAQRYHDKIFTQEEMMAFRYRNWEKEFRNIFDTVRDFFKTKNQTSVLVNKDYFFELTPLSRDDILRWRCNGCSIKVSGNIYLENLVQLFSTDTTGERLRPFFDDQTVSFDLSRYSSTLSCHYDGKTVLAKLSFCD